MASLPSSNRTSRLDTINLLTSSSSRSLLNDHIVFPSASEAMLAEADAKKVALPRPDWQRWLVVCMTSLGAGVQYTMRCNLSVALTRMPKQYHWSDGWDGPLLSAFFCGYFFGQVPASLLAQRAGAKRILCLSVLLTSLLNALIPLVAAYPGAVFCIRAASGLAQAATFPMVGRERRLEPSPCSG